MASLPTAWKWMLLLALAVCAPVAGTGWLRATTRGQVEEMLERSHKQPWQRTFPDGDSSTAVPEPAAPLYRRAADACSLDKVDPDNAVLAKFGHAYPSQPPGWAATPPACANLGWHRVPSTEAAVLTGLSAACPKLRACNDALALLRTASRASPVRGPLDLWAADDTELGGALIRLVRLSLLQAMLQDAAAGSGRAHSVSAALMGVRVAQDLARDSGVIGRAAGSATEGLCLAAITDLLAHGSLSGEEAATVASSLLWTDRTWPPRTGTWEAEVLSFAPAFFATGELSEKPPQSADHFEPEREAPVLGWFMSAAMRWQYLRAGRELLASANAPFVERVQRMGALEDWPLATFPNFSGYEARFAFVDAKRRLVALAALEAARQRGVQVPSPPGMDTTDPLTGRPFEVRLEDGKWMIRSRADTVTGMPEQVARAVTGLRASSPLPVAAPTETSPSR